METLRRERSVRVAWQVAPKASAPAYGDEVLQQGVVASLLVLRRTDVLLQRPTSIQPPFAFENMSSRQDDR